MDYSYRNEFVPLGTVNLLPVSFQSLNYDVCENMIYQKDEKAHSPKVKKKQNFLIIFVLWKDFQKYFCRNLTNIYKVSSRKS